MILNPRSDSFFHLIIINDQGTIFIEAKFIRGYVDPLFIRHVPTFPFCTFLMCQLTLKNELIYYTYTITAPF